MLKAFLGWENVLKIKNGSLKNFSFSVLRRRDGKIKKRISSISITPLDDDDEREKINFRKVQFKKS
jgi:hypothetical protein